MKLTILQTGQVPVTLRDRHQAYPKMFARLFDRTGLGFTYDTVDVIGGEALPDPGSLDAVLITGSSAGVYEDHAWIAPLRDFIRAGYTARTPMVGICFGHQIMADSLGGDVRKSEKGWGLGRHDYRIVARPDFMADAPETLSVACSHQDQVIVPPDEADVFMASDFTPNAGLVYRNGAALSFQPHPEFDDDYTLALAEMRRGKATDDVVETALASVAKSSDSDKVGEYIGRFFKRR